MRDLKLEIEVDRGGFPVNSHVASSEFGTVVVGARDEPFTRKGWGGLVVGGCNRDCRGSACCGDDGCNSERRTIDLAEYLDSVDSLHSQIRGGLHITFVVVNVSHSDVAAPDAVVVVDNTAAHPAVVLVIIDGVGGPELDRPSVVGVIQGVHKHDLE